MVAKSSKKPAADEKPARKSNLPERPTYKYGIAQLVTALGITGDDDQAKARKLRARLRTADIEKNEGDVYGWDTKAEFDEVVAKLKKGGAKEPATKPQKEAKAAGADRKTRKAA